MSNSIETIGIVGFGPMGKLMSETMLPEAVVSICDPALGHINNESVKALELSDEDAVLLTVPASALWGVLNDVLVKPAVRRGWSDEMKEDWKEPLLIEPSSVKLFPEKLVEMIDPDYPELLHCHPLFGPQSASDGLQGLKVVVTKKRGEKAEEILDLWDGLGLDILEMSAETHDREMAKIQAVTFILGRLASNSGILALEDSTLATPSSKVLCDLARLDVAHSEELFRTIIGFNPFVTKEIRKLEHSLGSIHNDNSLSALALYRLGLV